MKLQPQTGDLHERYDADTNTLVSAKIAEFKRLFVEYPRQSAFHSRCDFLAKLGRATRGEPQMGFRVLGPTGSGKSRAAEIYTSVIAPPYLRDEARIVPAVHVRLPKAATPKRLMAGILEKYGDPFSDNGTEATLRKRVQICFERFQTELLFVDEVQHLNFRSTDANDVTDHLKAFLDAGAIPMVFLGTDEAEDMFKRNLQLNGRLLPPCDFPPLNGKFEEDRALFHGYVASLSRAMTKAKLMPESSDLSAVKVLSCLHEVSGGVIGRVSRLMQTALEIAFRRSASLVEPYDLAIAVDRWAVPQGFVATNPFVRGGRA